MSLPVCDHWGARRLPGLPAKPSVASCPLQCANRLHAQTKISRRAVKTSEDVNRVRATSTEEASSLPDNSSPGATVEAADLTRGFSSGSTYKESMGTRTYFSRPTQILTPDEVLRGLYGCMHENAQANYLAFYSSRLGGITTDPALMVVPMDDHLVHRGHAVFDTATMTQGYLYQLDDHLDRFYISAAKAALVPPFPRPQLRRIILETAAASQRFDGSIRYWLGAGQGGFGISPLECLEPSFYCMVYHNREVPDHAKGWKVKTSPVPIKDPYFATLKSNNYLPNALLALDAQLEGFDQGVFVDDKGYVAEGSVMNIGMITQEGEFVVPPFEQALAGCTLKRLLHLLQENVASCGMMKSIYAITIFRMTPQAQSSGEDDILSFIRTISQRKFTVEEAKQAKEVFMVGSSTMVMPVIQWDDHPFLNMKPDPEVGPLALALRALLLEDLDPKKDRGQHVEVPYDFLTKGF